jgi:hypothetical protein
MVAVDFAELPTETALRECCADSDIRLRDARGA